MARKNTAPALKPASQASKGPRSPGDARKDLLDRAARNVEGACHYRSDPLADAKSARVVVEAARVHAQELARRGLSAAYGEAARIPDAIRIAEKARVQAGSDRNNEMVALSERLLGAFQNGHAYHEKQPKK